MNETQIKDDIERLSEKLEVENEIENIQSSDLPKMTVVDWECLINKYLG